MLFDTDILIWVQRGNLKAARLIDTSPERFLSVYSYMELLQTAKNSQQHHYLKDFLSTFGFLILPLTEGIGHRALVYIEEYTLSSRSQGRGCHDCRYSSRERAYIGLQQRKAFQTNS